MTVPERVFRTRFESKTCPKCRKHIKPITMGESNEMHGYKLICPECERFVGWGGKIFAAHLETCNK